MMSRMPLIVVADDDPLVLRALSRVLSEHGFDVKPAPSAARARQACEAHQPDLLITDINMPGNFDLELLRWEPIRSGRVPIVLITGKPSVDTAIEALQSSVVDYILKPVEAGELVRRVRAALEKAEARRTLVHAAEQAKRLLDALQPGPSPTSNGSRELSTVRLTRAEQDSLSNRERDVLDRLAQGRAAPEIADLLGISPYTVRNHMKAIYRKLNVSSQVELLHKMMSPQ